MPLHSSESLILKQIDFHENDKIITFLTKDKGKKSGILRGSKKIKSKHVGLSEPFTHVTIFYFEKATTELVRVQKLDLLNSFYSIRQKYEDILYATYFIELIHLCVIDPVESAHFFDLLLSTLQNLEQHHSYQQIKVHFEKNLLEFLGIAPNFEFCCQCHGALWQSAAKGLPRLKQTARHQLDCAEGGIRCPNCNVSQPTSFFLSAGTLCYLHTIGQKLTGTSKIQATQQNQEEWETAFLAYFQYHFDKKPKSHLLLKSGSQFV